MRIKLLVIILLLATTACGGSDESNTYRTNTGQTSANQSSSSSGGTCPSGTLAVTSEAKCYTTSDSDNGEYTDIYPKGAVVISSGRCEGRYVKLNAGCWINKLAVAELE